MLFVVLKSLNNYTDHLLTSVWLQLQGVSHLTYTFMHQYKKFRKKNPFCYITVIEGFTQ